ncbi:MAG: signal peptidase I [Acidobacteria bacterium]|nr:signal peptidase I [Acidobacteriota bacterium]
MAEPYRKSSLRDTFESLVVTVILAIFGTTFVVQAFKIPTGSMENTLLIGDHLLVNKFAFAYPEGPLARFLPYRKIQRDDVVVFKFPGDADNAQEPGEHFVKRVIGVPGDRIRIVNRQVFVNGKAVPEPFVRNTYPNEVRPGDDFPPVTWGEMQGATSTWRAEFQNYVKNGQIVVPPHEYFVMGDNREESWDSRFWGFVPRKLISGRPLIIYWSYETPHGQYEQNTLGDRLKQTAGMIVHFFSKTRWSRTFKLIH